MNAVNAAPGRGRRHRPGQVRRQSATPSSTTAAPTSSRPATSASAWRCAVRRPGDGGLAIHVLSDLAGNTGRVFTEETELLAFDCFRDEPHYHYGPRNKNHRIFWDKTLVPDPLGWCLDQFKTGKLKAMLERAGYPGVAADLDEDLLASVIPQVEARGREMEAGGIPAEVTPNLVQ